MGKIRSGNGFWRIRSKGYGCLEWATRAGYLQHFIKCGNFQPTDIVLDVGTGTGIVAHAVAPYVKRLVGVDFSTAMVKQAIETRRANEQFELGDIRSLEHPDCCFDKVTARMVFHHILEDTEQAMCECHRVLVPGGKMILSEGVPPHPTLKQWYSEMFALKEERLTFVEEDLIALMEKAGFVSISVYTHISHQVSIRNWLDNSGLPQEKQDAIMEMHLELNGAGHEFYNMTVQGNDVLLDMKHVILVGSKR